MIAEGLHARAGPTTRIFVVLTEEALIVLAALAACALLILGVLELLWPTRPKRLPRRPPARPHVARPHRQSALVRHTRDRGQPPYIRRQTPLTSSPVPLAPLAFSLRPAVAAPPAAPPEIEIEAPATPAAVDVTPAPDEPSVPDPVSPEREPAEHEPVTVALAEAAPCDAPSSRVEVEAAGEGDVSEGDESIVERCFALYQAQRYADVVARGTGTLTGGGAGGSLTAPREKSALWSVVALAHQARGE